MLEPVFVIGCTGLQQERHRDNAGPDQIGAIPGATGIDHPTECRR